MLMKISSIWFYIAILSALAAGFIVGTCYYMPGVEFEKELNPIDAVSLLVTVIIAIVVAMHFDIVKERRKGIQDIAASRINEIYGLINTLQDKVGSREIHLVEANSTLKRINTSLQLVFTVITEKNISVKYTVNEYQGAINEIKKLATDVPLIQGTGEYIIKIEQNIVKYSASRAAEIEAKIEIVKNKVFELQVALCSI